MELTDFRDDLLNRANARASIEGVFTADAFMAEAAELLVDAGEMDSLDLVSFAGAGRRRKSLAINGFHHDDNDKSVSLVVLHFVGGSGVPKLTHTEAANSLRSLENYLCEARSGDFLVEREPSTLEYQLAQTLQELNERAVSRYRLYLVTDARLSERARVLESSETSGTPVEFHIWDMQRFHRVHESGQGREALELDLRDWGIPALPALKVADSAGDVTTFLAAVPGQLLASLYRHHGSRLLEGNVRSFLTIRGKINRGIRDTIARNPAHFLAYNNGISATAAGVEFQADGITKIIDLQIVNGGQTTASLFYASQGGRETSLDDVYVQMKLVVVSPSEAQEMVPLISRFANSQNAVREDDFFSNSPFHVRMEELSKKLLAPAQPGVNFQTKWYYERTRGQYLNERNRRSSSEQRKFEAEFPRAQVITKTDAAKYEVAWDQQPHLVSGGAQKNFKAYAALVADRFAKEPAAFNDNYYRRVVAKAILFNAVRAGVAKAPWYEPGYLANLAAFAVAKLSLEISRSLEAKSFDLLKIWENQSVGEETLKEAVLIAKAARDVLTGPNRLVVNVTEWAKREAAWKQLAGQRHDLSREFLRECIPPRLNSAGELEISVNVRFPLDESERTHAEGIDDSAWRSIQAYLGPRSMLTAPEAQLLKIALSHSGRMLDVEEARDLLHLYVKALNSGWPEELPALG